MRDDSKVNVIVQNQEGGRSPSSDLDFQAMQLDGRWGDPQMNEELKTRLQATKQIKLLKGSELKDGKGGITILEEDTLVPTSQFLWNELSIFTRDFRLGNLDDRDYRFAMHYTTIASDCLRLGMNRAFTVALSRVAAILELSQSKKGFLRNLLNKRHTITENKDITESPNLILPKKSGR